MRLSRFKIPITVVAILASLFDLLLAVRLYLNGYPKYAAITDGRVTVHPIPFTSTDWLISLMIVPSQVGLFYLLWKSWQRSQH
jgi:hypothetical protein